MESSSSDRIIVLVDMDCFYVQVEQKLHPEYKNKPCAVVQYETWKGGGILAVNYEAKAKGVTRFMRGDEARQKCPDIHLFSVPEIRAKADLTRYREAGFLVLDVLCEYSDCVERASFDEAYLDMTSVISSRIQNAPPVTVDQLPNTFVVGWEGENAESRKDELQKWLQMIYEEEHLYNDRMLALTAVIVEEIRLKVYEKTGYTCSAGIAHNKMLSKLSCGVNKPNKQTVLPQSSIHLLFKTIPIKKVRNLGGKLGKAVRKKFNVENMGDLIDVPKSQFVSDFGEKTGYWLYNIVRGIENEPVISRHLSKSVGSGRNFPGNAPLSTRKDVTHWVKRLSSDLVERLIKDQNTNKRFARLLTVSIRNKDSNGYPLVSRSCPIHVYNSEKLAHDALMAISKLNTSTSDTLWKPSIYTMSMVASKFEDKLDGYGNIQSYFIGNKRSGSEKEINLSTLSTSVSVKCSNGRNDPLNSTDLKSPKNSGHSNKSISYFSGKQPREIECLDNIIAVNTKEDKNLDQKDDLNSLDCFNTSDSNEIVMDNKCNKTSEVCVKENSKGLTGKQAKSVGFFAKKLAEHSELNCDIEFEGPCDVDNMNSEQLNRKNEVTLLETSFESLPSTSSVSDICTDLDPELTKLCDQCNKHIPVWEEIEHLDYHLALNLSNEISKPFVNNSPFVSKSSITGKSTAASKLKVRGRKRSSLTKPSSQAKKSFVQKNTLDAFVK